MENNSPRKYRKSKEDGALRQGEILSDVIQLGLIPARDASPIELKRTIHKFAVIVTPDCDLEWDFNARETRERTQKIVPNVLMCIVQAASELARFIMKDIDNQPSLSRKGLGKSRTWANTKKNKDERFHVLERVDVSLDAGDEGIPALGIDFKEYFTVPTDALYSSISGGETKRRCRLEGPYMQHLVSRFAYFQSRVALPSEHHVDKYVLESFGQPQGKS